MTTSSTSSKPSPPSREEIERERCRRDPARFVPKCSIQVEDGGWVPFALWPSQAETVRTSLPHRLLIWLKARQLGLTWLALALGLHEVVFRPGVTLLLFSLRDEEAVELLARLKGMHDRLPQHLKARPEGPLAREPKDSGHEWVLPNGSRAKAFPANRGDSYTASMAIVDEADLVADLDNLLGSVKPTIDAGGRLLLLSRSDKSRPSSAFKRVYRAAKAGGNGWFPVFLPWHARPSRTAAWYEEQRRDVENRTGSLDGLHEQYPATDEEALAPRSLDKRIAPEWVRKCYRELKPSAKRADGQPALPGLTVHVPPQAGRLYVVGADPAEGNPTSDESALCVLDLLTGEEAASLAGRLQPSAFADALDKIGKWYGGAPALVERNNHGHAVLLWLETNGTTPLVCGHDGRPGWLSSVKGKALLYNAAADAFRNGETVLHDFTTLQQLQSIEGSTLRAPDGEHDDRADAYALALVAVIAVAQADEEREGVTVVTT